jgi:hypothetical protein
MNKFEVFEQWLTQKGTHFPKLFLKVKEFSFQCTLLNKISFQDLGNDERGCMSQFDILNEETIVEIPLKCLITVEMVKTLR